MRIILIVFILFIFFVNPLPAEVFELLLEGHGHVESYIYFNQDSNYFIDTEIDIRIENFRYKRFFLIVDLFKETHMGRKYNSNMVFDPTRAHWSFGFSGRLELEKYFIETQIHHDCFHDIDRWRDNSVYWNSPRIGFGSIGYLNKNWYRNAEETKSGFKWVNSYEYFVMANFFAPKGGNFQKNHDYEIALNTNLKYRILRYNNFGVDTFLYNLWVLNTENQLRSQNRLDIDISVYGKKGTFVLFLHYWIHDNQSIRSRENHKFASGLRVGF